MIKANELRIGNWYNEFGIPKQTDPKFILQLYQVELANKIAIDVSPIPLSPDILEKCGFDNEFDNYYSNRKHVMESDYKVGSFALFYHDEESYHTSDALHRSNFNPIKYLHQLQNLFFALTGNELEINLNVPA